MTAPVFVKELNYYWSDLADRWVHVVLGVDYSPNSKVKPPHFFNSGFCGAHDGKDMCHVMQVSLKSDFFSGRAAHHHFFHAHSV